MKDLKHVAKIAFVCFSLLLWVGVAHATDISGAISSTLVITADSKLVGNVTCTVSGAPCIQFGAPDIELELNGFIMTGQANANFGCNALGPTLGESGIDTNGQSNLSVEGPGLVRRFRDHGINVSEDSTNVTVRGVTLSTNCHNGIQVSGSNSEIAENSAVRNSSIATLPCGGIEVKGSSNHIQRNEVSGNGLFFPAPSFFNDFGIGVFGNNNLIEENSITGNTPHGMRLFPGATGNTVRRNMALGNNPIQVSIDHSFGVVDFSDANAAGANTFEDNLCERSLGGAASACPNFPNLSD